MCQKIADLHATLTERLADVADALDNLFDAADEVAAVAENDPTMSAYVDSVSALLGLTLPTLPPPPNA
jgi:hypothetical protein